MASSNHQFSDTKVAKLHASGATYSAIIGTVRPLGPWKTGGGPKRRKGPLGVSKRYDVQWHGDDIVWKILLVVPFLVDQIPQFFEVKCQFLCGRGEMGNHTHDGFCLLRLESVENIFASICGPNNLPGLVDKPLKCCSGFWPKKMSELMRDPLSIWVFFRPGTQKIPPFFWGGNHWHHCVTLFFGERCLRKHQHQKWLQSWVDFSWKPGCSCSMENWFRWCRRMTSDLHARF